MIDDLVKLWAGTRDISLHSWKLRLAGSDSIQASRPSSTPIWPCFASACRTAGARCVAGAGPRAGFAVEPRARSSDPGSLPERKIRMVRKHGYATNMGVSDAGMSAIGLALRDPHGRAFSGITSPVDPDEVI